MRQRIRSLARLGDALTLARRAAEARKNALDEEARALSRREDALVRAISDPDTGCLALHAAYAVALVRAERRKRDLREEIERVREEILSSTRSARGACSRADRLEAALDDLEERKRLDEAAVSFFLRTASRKPE